MRRYRLWLTLLLMLGMGRFVYAQARTYESITVAGTAVGLAALTTAPAFGGPVSACEARLETAQVRYRFDGTDPTSSEGVILEVGDLLKIGSYRDAAAIKFIRTGGTSGVLKVHCWR